eukprot:sb/3466513/
MFVLHVYTGRTLYLNFFQSITVDKESALNLDKESVSTRVRKASDKVSWTVTCKIYMYTSAPIGCASSKRFLITHPASPSGSFCHFYPQGIGPRNRCVGVEDPGIDVEEETAGELGGYEGALENFRRGIYTIRHRIAADAHYLHRGELGAKESKETQLLMMTRVEGIEVVLENQERILAMMGNVLKKQEEPARKRLIGGTCGGTDGRFTRNRPSPVDTGHVMGNSGRSRNGTSTLENGTSTLENFRGGIYTIRHRIAADAHYLHRGRDRCGARSRGLRDRYNGVKVGVEDPGIDVENFSAFPITKLHHVIDPSGKLWGAVTIWVFGGLFTGVRCQKS